MRITLTFAVLIMLFSVVFAQEVVDRVLAVVDDDIILESEVLQFAQSFALQNRVDPMKYIQDPKIKSQILNELIDQKVLLSRAKEDTNIFVEDREVKRELDNRLDQIIDQVGSPEELEKLYDMPIREIKRDFEKSIREGLLIEKLKQRKMSGTKVSRMEIEDFYQQYKKELSDRPETITLAHILIKVSPEESAKVRAESLIDSLYNLLMNGADFEELAKNYSQDPGTAKRGGLLGWASRGDYVPEFEEVAFSLNEGEISKPLISRFGYHIIRLNQRTGEKISASHILIKLTPSDEDRKRSVTLADSIYNLLIGGADFGEIAKEYSTDDETKDEGGVIGSFSKAELIPLYSKAIENLQAGEFTEPLKSDLGIQIVKLMDIQKARSLTLEHDWETISKMTLNKKKEDLYVKWVDKLKKDVYIEMKVN